MTINKGRHSEHHDYLYTCGYCNAKGYIKGLPCPHCYNLDLPTLLKEFETARGERYYALLKAILSIKGRAIYDRAMEIRNTQEGKLKIADLCHLLIEFQFPHNRMKPLAEWLEECRVCPAGTYEHLQARGFKVKDSLRQLGYIPEVEK